MPDSVNLPYGFEEFERRAASAAARRKSWAYSAAASVAALGLVVTLAIVTQRGALPESYATSDVESLLEAGEMAMDPDETQPALVDLGQLELQGELEDRIAWFDAQLSVGRVNSAPPEQLRQLESAREQIADSLQHVSYAHSLLSL